MRCFTVILALALGLLLAGTATARPAAVPGATSGGPASPQDLRAPDRFEAAAVTQDLRAPDRVATGTGSSSIVERAADVVPLPPSGGGLSTLAIVLIAAGGAVALGGFGYALRIVAQHGHAAA